MMTVSGGVHSRMGEILRVAAGFIVSYFAELRQIATANADGSGQKQHKPAIECDNLARQCEGIGGAAVRRPGEGVNPIVAQIPRLAGGTGLADAADTTQDGDCGVPIDKKISTL
jgi:hypothetical protein